MSPRPKGSRTVGAHFDVTPGGRLRINFTWDARRYRITSDLTDSRDNRREMQKACALVGAEIRAGTFELAKRFPSVVAPKITLGPTTARPPSVADLIPGWIADKRRRRVLESRTRKYESHLRLYVSRHVFGRLDPHTLTRADFELFISWMLSEAGEGGKGVGEKTASNVVRGTVRAFLRDIDADASLQALSRVAWERYVPGRVQDPLTEQERAQVFAWFAQRRPLAESVSIRLRFSGATPSEARGFNVGDFSRSTSTITVRRTRSEDLQHVNPTKTTARLRPIALDPELAADVATLCGIRGPDEPLLPGVYESSLTKTFTRAQVALGIRHRSIYQAKHTFATLALLEGESPALVARSLGIGLGTLGKYYAAALQSGRVAYAVAPNKGRRPK